MGKYFSGAEFASAPIGPRGCKDLPGGYVNDVIYGMCWAVSGQTIKIGPTEFTIMQGFECTNFNFRVEGTQPPAPNKASLNNIPKDYKGGV